MKKLIIAAVLAASVSTVGMVYARGPMGGCGMSGCNNAGGVSGEQWKKFQADSIDLREQMMSKRFALQKENLKATPDAAVIAGLEAEIAGLRTKVQEIRAKAGLPTCDEDGPGPRCGGEMSHGAGNCAGPMHRGPGAECGNCPGDRS
jgi:hypothetical protein